MRLELPYRLCDVFTATPFQGNQLAVFEDAGELTVAEMQKLANETNLSETTFIIRRDPAIERQRGSPRPHLHDPRRTPIRRPSDIGDGMHDSQLLSRVCGCGADCARSECRKNPRPILCRQAEGECAIWSDDPGETDLRRLSTSLPERLRRWACPLMTCCPARSRRRSLRGLPIALCPCARLRCLAACRYLSVKPRPISQQWARGSFIASRPLPANRTPGRRACSSTTGKIRRPAPLQAAQFHTSSNIRSLSRAADASSPRGRDRSRQRSLCQCEEDRVGNRSSPGRRQHRSRGKRSCFP